MRRSHYLSLAAVMLAGSIGLTVGGASPGSGAMTVPATVTVEPAQAGPPVSATALGVNVASWDPHLFTPGAVARLRSAGVTLLRWPGGSYADTVNWKTLQGNFLRFGHLLKQIGAQGIVTVNYGTGTPAEAAQEVQFAVDHHLGIRYWEIGNEVYGDGEYEGVKWEANDRPQKGPAAYGANVLKFARAMRAVDPGIQIGAVQTVPGVWPSGLLPYWDRTSLPIMARAINFVVLHWYPQNPGQENDRSLLQDPAQVPGFVATMKGYLRAAAGKRAQSIRIFTDETNNVSSEPDKQTVSLVNALFLAEDFNAWLQAGVANVSWWDLHNGLVKGPNESSSLYGTTDYGDYGLLSAGNPGEPRLNQPFPPYFGLVIVHDFVGPHDRYAPASSNRPDLVAYATLRPNGGRALLLINRSPTVTFHATVEGLGGPVGRPEIRRFYGMASQGIATARATWTGTLTVPPYSLTEVTLPPSRTRAFVATVHRLP